MDTLREALRVVTASTYHAGDGDPLPLETGARVAMSRRIGLVGCVKEKHPSGSWPAEELYTSILFSGRRRYVCASCDEWWILSAAFGLVHPDTPLTNYDVTLKTAGRCERRQWSQNVLRDVRDRIAPSAGDVFELHAGADYRDFGLTDGLRALGAVIAVPTAGMPIGKQLQFYANAALGRP